MANKNSNSNQLINYIEKIIKEKLRKKIKTGINVLIFEDISKEYEELNYQYKQFNQWVTKCQYSHPDDRSRSFSEQLSEKVDYLIKKREKLDNKIISIVIEKKLFRKNLFIRYLEKLKFIIKKIFDVKKNDIINNNLKEKEIKTKNDVLKFNVNKHEINSNDFENQSLISKCKQNSLKYR